MSNFKGNTTESLGNIVPTVTSPTPKTVLVCTCGATKFKWVATIGVVKAGGFVPDAYEYECVGCGKKYNEASVRKFFQL